MLTEPASALAGDSGVGDDAVEAAERGDARVDQILRVIGVAHVTADSDRLSAAPGDLGGKCGQTIFTPCGERDRTALCCECPGDDDAQA